jgi:DNA polymerase
MMPWGEERPALFFYGQDTYTRKWGDTDTYGGKLAENVTQAVARDILSDAMVRLDQHGWEIVMHVHDEIVCEDDEHRALHRFPQFKQIMSDLPEWAEGLPVAVDGWVGKRYRK